MRIYFFAATLLAAMSLMNACYYDVEEDLYPDTGCDTDSVTFSGVVQPILQANCLTCHNATAQFGGVALEGYDQVLTYANNGALLGTIKRDPAFSPMPQGQPRLQDCTIEKIETWILAGAPNN